jgi:hypothetical protein
MPTTTNYGWTTPADTDLVKDGASAIRTLGTAIDTTVFNNASAGIAKTIVDAKGDIIAATAADTVSRLAVGANDTVLTADSTAATGLKWATPAAGGMTVIASGSLSGASVVLSSIPGTYNDLRLIIRDYIPATSGSPLLVRINNDSGTKYRTLTYQTALSNPYTFPSDSFIMVDQNNTTSDSLIVCELFDYANATTWKIIRRIATGNDTTTSTSVHVQHSTGIFSGTTAITSLGLLPNSGNFTSGTYTLYGVK